MSAGGPALAEPRGLSLSPGSGIVKRDRPRRRRRDDSRQAAAQAKRERKNAKRLRDWMNRHDREIWRRGNPHCFPWGLTGGVPHG
jgi:hypothetical protein